MVIWICYLVNQIFYFSSCFYYEKILDTVFGG